MQIPDTELYVSTSVKKQDVETIHLCNKKSKNLNAKE